MKAIAYGVDGCRKGWFYVGIGRSDGEIKIIDWEVITEIRDLVSKSDDAPIFIDIPIGLKECGPDERKCDKEARKALGQPRGTSVFRVPVRDAISAESYVEASKKNYELTDKKLSIQTWGIVPKIREVDELMRACSKARKLIREVHPEICFWALNNKRAMAYNKKKKEGREERIAVLSKAGLSTCQDDLEKICKCFLRRDVHYDDILDAMAAAVTASSDSSMLCKLPAQVEEKDQYGLPMEMVYITL